MKEANALKTGVTGEWLKRGTMYLGSNILQIYSDCTKEKMPCYPGLFLLYFIDLAKGEKMLTSRNVTRAGDDMIVCQLPDASSSSTARISAVAQYSIRLSLVSNRYLMFPG